MKKQVESWSMRQTGIEITATETARRLGIRLDYTLMLLRSGKFAGARKVDGEWRVPAEAVEARLREREKEAVSV